MPRDTVFSIVGESPALNGNVRLNVALLIKYRNNEVVMDINANRYLLLPPPRRLCFEYFHMLVR